MHFTTAKLQESAGLIGKEVPHLYTLSKDGALFAWTYRKPEAAEAEAEAAAAEGDEEPAAAGRKRRRTAAGEGGSSSEDEDEGGSSSGCEDEEGGSSSSEEEGGSSSGEDEQQQQRQRQAAAQPPAAPEQSRTFAGGHWKLTEKHYFNQRGAKLSAADFQVRSVRGAADGCVAELTDAGGRPAASGKAASDFKYALPPRMASRRGNNRACWLPAPVLQGAVGLLAVGFSHGIFELLQLPDLTTVHTLSIGRCALRLLGLQGWGCMDGS